jgi:hypothetical protein
MVQAKGARAQLQPRRWAFVLFAVLAACADRPPAPLPTANGQAVVLGPDIGFDPGAPPPDWFLVPPRRASGIATAESNGARVLSIAAPGRSLIGRRIETSILASPYLRWGWYVDPALYGGGPGDGLPRGLRLMIGFRGGTPGGPQLLDRLFGGLAGDFPPHDRALELRLGGIGAPRPENATVEFAAVSDQGMRRQMRRAAYGQSGKWHVETVDLAAIYAGFWPRDRIGEVTIAFVAVGGLPAQLPETVPIGYVAEILLTR